MKKFSLFLFSLSTALAVVQTTNLNIKEDIKKVHLTKKEENNLINDFKKHPVKYIFSIYDDYHFNRVDKGIKKALSLIDYLNKKNPDDEIKNPYLRWKKVYQIKSTIYTLLGLLYIKKAGQADEALRKKEEEYILKVLQKKGQLTNKDLDYLAKLARQEDAQLEKNSKFYIDRAVQCFKTAIRIFPDNPYPYIQLANFYKDSDENDLASKYLIKAAKIFLKYNQKDRYLSLIEDAKKEGYSEDIIKKLEELQK